MEEKHGKLEKGRKRKRQRRKNIRKMKGVGSKQDGYIQGMMKRRTKNDTK